METQTSHFNQSFHPKIEHKPNFWRVATIVLFIVLIGIGGIYLFNTQSQKPIITSSQQISQLRKPSPTNLLAQPIISSILQRDELIDWEILPSGDWRTYYNDDLNYSMKYPQDWFLYSAWESRSISIRNKEDKEYGKGLEERVFPIDNTNTCSITIIAHSLSSFASNGVKTMLDLVKLFKETKNLEKVQFNNSEAIFVKPYIISGEGIYAEASLWFPGKIADLIYYISMSADPNIADNCRKYFNTIVKSYQ